MAIGDQVADLQSIDAQSDLVIRPVPGTEWKISNIFFNGACKLYFCSAAENCLIATYLGAGRWAGVEFIVSNDYFCRLKNTSSVAKLIGYVGEVTK